MNVENRSIIFSDLALRFGFCQDLKNRERPSIGILVARRERAFLCSFSSKELACIEKS